MGDSPDIGGSNQLTRSRGTSSRGAKRKAPMHDLVEAEMERMSMDI